MQKLKNTRSEKFYTGLLIRVTGIVSAALAFAFLAVETRNYYSILALALVEFLFTWELIRFNRRKRNEIAKMLDSIRDNDVLLKFPMIEDHPYSELSSFLNEIGDIIRKIRIEKESQLQYLQIMVEQVGTGLISFDPSGKIDIINKAAMELLGVPEIHSIEVLNRVHPDLPSLMKGMRPGDRRVVRVNSGSDITNLSMQVSSFRIGEKDYWLVSLHDIKKELDEKEVESWQKMVRILTHEIANSITPVTSVVSTIAGFFRQGDRVLTTAELSDLSIRDAITGMGYVEERSKNLLSFVNRFRSLTKLPDPHLQSLPVNELVSGVIALKKDELAEQGVQLIHVPATDHDHLICDRGLIESVLINLINNAAEALSGKKDAEHKVVEISSEITAEGKALLKVTDNGPGIRDELLDTIFFPFFTTKEQGSGIGLSLSRQIMKLHGGTLTVFSKPDTETQFRLNF